MRSMNSGESSEATILEQALTFASTDPARLSRVPRLLNMLSTDQVWCLGLHVWQAKSGNAQSQTLNGKRQASGWFEARPPEAECISCEPAPCCFEHPTSNIQQPRRLNRPLAFNVGSWALDVRCSHVLVQANSAPTVIGPF